MYTFSLIYVGFHSFSVEGCLIENSISIVQITIRV